MKFECIIIRIVFRLIESDQFIQPLNLTIVHRNLSLFSLYTCSNLNNSNKHTFIFQAAYLLHSNNSAHGKLQATWRIDRKVSLSSCTVV